MKLLMFVAAMLMTTPTFAKTFADLNGSHTYNTRGTWRDVVGMENTWSSVLTVSTETGEDRLVIVLHEVLTIQQGEESVELTEVVKLSAKGNNFYDVLLDSEVVGEAYCWDQHCHSSYSKEGEKFEETFTFSDDSSRISRIGSSVSADGAYTFAFRGESVRAEN